MNLSKLLGMELRWNLPIAFALIGIHSAIVTIAAFRATADGAMEWSVFGLGLFGVAYCALAVALNGRWLRYTLLLFVLFPLNIVVISRFKPPVNYVGLAVPTSLAQLLISGAAGLMGLLFRSVKHAVPRRRRIPEGYCRRCEYDLRGNSSGICPECGLPCSNA